MQLGHYIPCLDDRTQPSPSLSSEVFEAHGLSLHCGAWHLDALCLENGSNLEPEIKNYRLK
jgi:hypothetical protein